MKELCNDAVFYIDDGADETSAAHTPATNIAGLSMSSVQLELGNLNVINFGRTTLGDQPVNGSNCSLDYDYYRLETEGIRRLHRHQPALRRHGGGRH